MRSFWQLSWFGLFVPLCIFSCKHCLRCSKSNKCITRSICFYDRNIFASHSQQMKEDETSKGTAKMKRKNTKLKKRDREREWERQRDKEHLIWSQKTNADFYLDLKRFGDAILFTIAHDIRLPQSLPNTAGDVWQIFFLLHHHDDRRWPFFFSNRLSLVYLSAAHRFSALNL